MKKLILIVFLGLVVIACQTKTQTSATEQTSSEITDCRYCGMPSLDFPKSNVKMETETGKTQWFCSPRCYFALRLDPKSNFTPQDKVWVTDYYTLEKIDAKTAFYITGSDILGAMGHDFIPTRTQADAENFKQEHKGAKVLAFDDINEAALKEVVNTK